MRGAKKIWVQIPVVYPIFRPNFRGFIGELFAPLIWTYPDGVRQLRLLAAARPNISFVEYRLFYKAVLQKRPKILRSLIIVATPYQERH